MKKHLTGPVFRKAMYIGPPNFLLAFKGRHDSKYGTEVADAYIEKLLARIGNASSANCSVAEKYLKSYRSEAAVFIESIGKGNITIKNTVIQSNPVEKDEIRTARKETGKVLDARNRICNFKEELCKINEEIISTHALLDQILIKISNCGNEKMLAYISGIRAKYPDYTFKATEATNPKHIYLDSHNQLDTAISKLAYSSFKEE